MQPKKHVIFLGAGASKGSGYPLANELRLLISSPSHLEKTITDYESKHNFQGRPIWIQANAFLKKYEEALKLFRNGGFATLDEFCKLAGQMLPNEIHGLRRLVRAILGTFNPEEHFERSEYYAFIQALFESDLVSLRDDVTVLTYNYDPYLEFLLHRALQHRWRVSNETPEKADISNAVTSGFDDPENRKWLKGSGFCVLKLHGSICYVNESPRGFQELFHGNAKQRGENLFAYEGSLVDPPILFPWEITNQKGLTGKESFIPPKSCLYTHEGIIYSLFNDIWARARREVQAAEKISFVGLSMHPFISDGLNILFQGKKGSVEIVIANPENILFDPNKKETHWSRDPLSPASIVSNILTRYAPELKKMGRLPGYSSLQESEVTLVRDFIGFIKTQMKRSV